jgi:hypothetical protein
MFGTAKTWRRARVALPFAALVGSVIAFAACDDDEDTNFVVPVIPTGAVVTFKDSTFDFTTLHVFKMPDTVVHLTAATGTPFEPTRQFDRAILDRVRADFVARGYMEATDPNVTPNFVVVVGATATTNYAAFVGYPFFTVWGFYPGWAFLTTSPDASWTIVYPWFAVAGTTAYDRGTLIVDLIPTVQVNPTTRTVRSAWTGVATTLLASSVNTANINAAIDEMFRQSPYLTAPAPVLFER